ncbi:YojF family protein [Bacillaceae bacterium S4-13-58]
MKAIEKSRVQDLIDQFVNEEVFIHLETTNGAYAKHFNEKAYNVGAYIRNARIKYSHGKIVENQIDDSFRVGLKHEDGWVYAEGLTDFELDDQGRLLMAGHNEEGKLMIAFEISRTPFDN